jgi:hypothetical protein
MIADFSTYASMPRLIRIIWLLVTVVEAIIGLRVLFRALGAREEGFVRFIYAISDRTVGQDRRHVIEVGALIGMLIIYFVGYLVVAVLVILAPGPLCDGRDCVGGW